MKSFQLRKPAFSLGEQNQLAKTFPSTFTQATFWIYFILKTLEELQSREEFFYENS